MFAAGARQLFAPLRDARVARNLGYLALVGFSVAFFAAWYAYVPRPVAFVLDNRLEPAARRGFVAILAAGTVAMPLGWILYHELGLRSSSPRRRACEFQRRVLVVRPFALAFLAPILLHPAIWSREPLLSLLVAIGALALVVCWTVPARGWRVVVAPAGADRVAPIVLALLIAGFCAYVSFYSIRLHHALETQAYDLGIFDNILANSSRGRLLYSAVEGLNHLGVHWSPILLLLVPLHAVAPRAETLLLVQAVAVGLAAWPLYDIVKRLGLGSLLALVFAALYLLHPAIEGAAFYEFHELAFGPVLLLGAYACWLRERRLPFWVLTALLLLVKEDMGIVVAAFGVHALVWRRDRSGFVLLGVGLAAFLVTLLLLMPIFSVGVTSFAWYYSALTGDDHGLVGVLLTLVTNPVLVLRHAATPQKALYLLQIFAPLAFLGLREIRGWPLLAYGVAAALLASKSPLYQLGFQYGLQLVPFAFLVAAHGLVRLGRPGLSATWRPSAAAWRALLLMGGLSLLCSYQHGMLYPRRHFRSGVREVDFSWGPDRARRYQELMDVVGRIPADAPVTASEILVPHVSSRLEVATLRYADDGEEALEHDYILLTREDGKRNRRRLRAAGRHRVEIETESFVLLGPGAAQ